MAKNDARAELKKGRAQFRLVGEAKLSDYTFSLGNSYGSGWRDNKMNLGVDCGGGNTVYADLSGGYFPDAAESLLYVHGITEEGGSRRDDYQNRFQLDWEDRFNEDILETVGDGCFIKVGIERDTKGKLVIKRFLSGFDAVQYLYEYLQPDMVLSITGQLAYQGSDSGAVYTKKEIKSIYLSDKKPEDYCATFTQTILLGYDSIGKPDAERGVLPIDAWVVDYVGKMRVKQEGDDDLRVEVRQNVAFPKTFELALLDGDKEKTAKLIKRFFKVSKKDAITELMVFGDLVEGADALAVSWDDVPEDIKELVEMGVLTEEEAKAKSAIGGNRRERRMVIRRPEISYTGEGDDRRPVVACDTTKYRVGDLQFLPALLEAAGAAPLDEKQTDAAGAEDGVGDDDILAMLEGI